MTDNNQLLEDAKRLDEIAASLEEEANKLEQVLVDVKEKVEKETAGDQQILNDSLTELDKLKEEADAEEQQGQVGAAQGKIDEM